MHRHSLLVLPLVMLSLAGCLSAGMPLSPGEVASSGAHGSEGSSAAVGWPPLEDAAIRPGVRVISEIGGCTSNFVFTSPDRASVYLGLAAHCVYPMELGDSVDIGPGVATGTIAYSSWITMDIQRDPEERMVGDDTCTHEPDEAVCNLNDFALIRVDDAYRHLVHPAVLHFGGPVDLADSSTAEVGDKVIAYGNSRRRPDAEPLHRDEGYVVEKPHPWTTTTFTAVPGIPGDSGSGVLTGGGRALGIRVTLGALPPGSNGVTSLDLALDYAREHAGVDARLATWDLLTGGVLPGR